MIIFLFVACSRTHDLNGISSSSVGDEVVGIDNHNSKWQKVTSQLPTSNL
jgi:hypothetical protein